MSDLFNSNKVNKTKATELFKVRGETEKEFLPPQFVAPKSDFSPLVVENTVAKNRLKAYQPRAIPQLEPVNITTLNLINPALLDFEGTPFKNDIVYPLGSKSEFIPKYTPQYFNLPYDDHLIKQVIYRYTNATIENSQEEMSFIRSIVDAAQTQAYGNGSIEGQLTRLSEMSKIRWGTGDKPRPAKSCYDILKSSLGSSTTIENLARIFSCYLPVGRVDSIIDQSFPGLFMKPSYYLDPEDDKLTQWFPSINMSSISGLPYMGKSKKETFTEALVMADSFVGGIMSVVKQYGIPGMSDAAQKKAQNDLKELMDEYWYLGCGILFPKAERYDRAKWSTKTRNIFSMPFASHIIASLISSPIMKNSLNATNYNTPSLYAFSPFHGGLDVILSKVRNAIGQHVTYVYADNWYVAYWEEDRKTHTWYSIDLVKAESQTVPFDGTTLAYYLLTRGHTIKDPVSGELIPAYNVSWAYIAMFIIPSLCIDASCLISNQQLQFPGQGSGNTWTFLLNHQKSAMLDYSWRRAGCPRPDTTRNSPFELKVLTRTNIQVVIELEVKDLEIVMDNVIATSSTEGYFGTEPSNNAPNTQPRVPLDLLGWDATYARSLNRFIPVLASSRLASSIAMAKKDVSRDFKQKPYHLQIYQLARFEALRMVGAWLYPSVDTALKERCDEIRKTLYKKFGSILEQDDWTEAFKNTEFGSMQELIDIDISVPVTFKTLNELNKGDPLSSVTPQEQKSMDEREKWDLESLVKLNYIDSPESNTGVEVFSEKTPKPMLSKSEMFATSMIINKLRTKRNEVIKAGYDPAIPKDKLPSDVKKLAKEFDAIATMAHDEIVSIKSWMFRSKEYNLPTSKPGNMKSGGANPLVNLKVPFERKEGKTDLQRGALFEKVGMGPRKLEQYKSEAPLEVLNLSRSAKKRAKVRAKKEENNLTAGEMETPARKTIATNQTVPVGKPDIKLPQPVEPAKSQQVPQEDDSITKLLGSLKGVDYYGRPNYVPSKTVKEALKSKYFVKLVEVSPNPLETIAIPDSIKTLKSDSDYDKLLDLPTYNIQGSIDNFESEQMLPDSVLQFGRTLSNTIQVLKSLRKNKVTVTNNLAQLIDSNPKMVRLIIDAENEAPDQFGQLIDAIELNWPKYGAAMKATDISG